MDQQTMTAISVANQRKAAHSLINTYPLVETIRFTDEGRTVGLGGSLWGAGAIVTVGGKEYREVLGFDPGTSYGEGLPDAPLDAVPGPVTVIYSDGTSEVLNG